LGGERKAPVGTLERDASHKLDIWKSDHFGGMVEGAKAPS